MEDNVNFNGEYSKIYKMFELKEKYMIVHLL